MPDMPQSYQTLLPCFTHNALRLSITPYSLILVSGPRGTMSCKLQYFSVRPSVHPYKRLPAHSTIYLSKGPWQGMGPAGGAHDLEGADREGGATLVRGPSPNTYPQARSSDPTLLRYKPYSIIMRGLVI